MSLSQYNFVNFDGFGSSSMTEVSELNKALEAGVPYLLAPQDRTGGGAMQVESLDASLKSVTFDLKHLKLWPVIAKDRAYNTIEEYNRVDAYGDQARGFVSEGQLPRSTDSSYSRQTQRVRFLGITRELTHVYTVVKHAHGDAIAQEIYNGTKHILEKAERALFDGRGMYSNDGKFDGQADILDQDLAWEGLDLQIRKGNDEASAKASAFTGYGLEEDVIIDHRGGILDEDILEDTARIVMENFGIPSHMFMDTKAHSELTRTLYPKERINTMGVQSGSAGYVLREFSSSAGVFQMVSSVFLRPKRSSEASAADSLAAPAQPTLSNEGADPDSKFVADDAGDYYYRATAIDPDAPESAKSVSSAAITVADGESVKVTVPAVAGAVAYAVYRSVKDSDSGHEFIGYVAPAVVGGAAELLDLNHKLPGLSQAYLLDLDMQVSRFKQLTPLFKMDLAILSPAYRWMQLMYAMPIVYAPRKNAIIENIGRTVKA